ncbi:MAG TPA: PIN domain-containing protein [Candidatus Thermoplasmatota archaeon]|nr:PIN domain-containing protein [Candidatus Thermoplasmatota archaeon]
MDSNIVFAGLLRDGATRALLIDPPLDLMSPEWMLAEIRRYREDIANRSGLMVEEVDLLLALLTEGIEVVPRETYEEKMKEAHARIGARDAGDVPFLALALARACDGIWTENTRDFEGVGIPLWTTERVVTWARSEGRT